MAPTNSEAQRRCRLQFPGVSPSVIFTGLLILVVLVIRFKGYTQIALAPIDDHEIPMYAADPLQGWFASETFRPWLRWRPMFFSIRAFEAHLWSTNAVFWYWCRIFEGILSGVLLSSSIARLTSQLVAIIYGSLFCILAVHDEVIGKLGTSETYSLLGISLWAMGASLFLVAGQSRTECAHAPNASGIRIRLLGATLLIVIGSIIASGSKEDMLLLMVPNLYFYLTASRYGLSRPGRYALVGVLAAQLLVASVVVHGLLQQGSDIYAQSAVGTSRFLSLQDSLSGPSGYLLIFGVAYIVYRLALHRKLLDELVLVSLFFVIVLLTLPIYYGARYPVDVFNTPTRYALAPQLILIAWASMALLDLCNGLRRHFTPQDAGGRAPIFGVFQVLAFAGGLLLWLTWATGFASTQFRQIAATAKNLPILSRGSREFQRGIALAALEVESQDRPVVIVATDPLQIENLVAAARYLYFLHHVAGDRILFYYTPSIRDRLTLPLSPQEQQIIRDLNQQDFLNKHSVRNAKKYVPDAILKPPVICLFVGYSTVPPKVTPRFVSGLNCVKRITTY